MKKLLAIILALCMMLSLCACGGGAGGNSGGNGGNGGSTQAPKEDSVAGFYELVALEDSEGYYEMDSEEMSHLNPDELSYVIMNDDNTATIMIECEEFEVTYNGSTFMNDDGLALDYDFKDGQLVIYYEEDTIFYYEKADREGPIDHIEKGGEAFSEDAIDSFSGDWHGWCEVNYGSGIYEEDEGSTFEIIARFVFDEDGNCQPFLAIPTEDPADNFQDLTVSYDSYGEYMYFYGELFGTEIDEGNFADLGGVLFGNLTLEEGDDYASISICMRRIGDTWDADIDSPYMPEEVQSYYEGMDLIDIAELYGVDLDLIPEE